MRFWIGITSFLSGVAAFYPYQDISRQKASGQLEPRQYTQPILKESLSSHIPRSGIHFPIRKLRKRANEYNIVTSKAPKFPHSIAIAQDGTDYTYFVSLQIGSQDFWMLIDTAAPSTWVMSTFCQSAICKAHDQFGEEDDPNLDVTNSGFGIGYGTGSVTGVLAHTNVRMADFHVPLTLGLVTEVSDDFNNYPMDGILGLGIGSDSNTLRRDGGSSDGGPYTTPSLLAAFKTAGLITRNAFGIKLSRHADGSSDGEFNIGAPNPNLYLGSLEWYSRVQSIRGFWELPLSAAAVGEDSNFTAFTSIAGSTSRSAVFDTGTSYILAPPNDAKALHKAIPGAEVASDGENFRIPCDSSTPIFLSFGSESADGHFKAGLKWRIKPADYIGGPLSDSDGTVCSSNIIGRTAFEPQQWLVGDVFLKNVYTMFDLDGSQIGFGALNEESKTGRFLSDSNPGGFAPTKTGEDGPKQTGKHGDKPEHEGSKTQGGSNPTGTPGVASKPFTDPSVWAWSLLAGVVTTLDLGLF